MTNFVTYTVVRASPSLLIKDPTLQQSSTKKARLEAPEATTDSEHALTAQTGSQKTEFPQPNITSPSMEAGPSSALSSPPTKGKGKRKGKGKAALEEKRAARFKVKCPQETLIRVERVRQQRLFMIDRSRSGSELRETFSVLGSTGNVRPVLLMFQLFILSYKNRFIRL